MKEYNQCTDGTTSATAYKYDQDILDLIKYADSTDLDHWGEDLLFCTLGKLKDIDDWYFQAEQMPTVRKFRLLDEDLQFKYVEYFYKCQSPQSY